MQQVKLEFPMFGLTYLKEHDIHMKNKQKNQGSQRMPKFPDPDNDHTTNKPFDPWYLIKALDTFMRYSKTSPGTSRAIPSRAVLAGSGI